MAQLGRAPAFRGLKASSEAASRAKRANRATNTRHELALRRALTARGARYRLHVATLAGKPDIVFPGARVVVFCDGDFWHGRNWQARRKRLAKGSNATYWVEKIRSNIKRDAKVTAALRDADWEVLRVWESDIHTDADAIAKTILKRVRARSQWRKSSGKKVDQSRRLSANRG